MKQLIHDLHDLIKDHREDEEFMTLERVANWINQFAEDDRQFILEETIYIFKKRYISKENGRKHVKAMVEWLTKNHDCKDVKEFISKSYFIDNQAEGKSQKILLEFLEEILNKDYLTSLDECNKKDPKYVIYLDDILCTGETIIHGLADESNGWFNLRHPDGGTNYDKFRDSKAILVLAYLAVHKYCTSKLRGRLYYALGKRDLGTIQYIWNTEFEIDNTDNLNSSLNYLFPIESIVDEEIRECKEQIELKINSKGHNLSKIQFRPTEKPQKEILFSSEENRIRYEKIILKKSIQYYQFIQDRLRSRPLGYGLNHDISFGFGTMIFTWRNVPFNTPLVFWYSPNDCTPLFDRIFT